MLSDKTLPALLSPRVARKAPPTQQISLTSPHKVCLNPLRGDLNVCYTRLGLDVRMNPEFRQFLLAEKSGWAWLKSKYGISKDQYLALLESQNYRCKLCGTTAARTEKTGRRRDKSALCVDHCHKTGRIRGLLCRSCNSMLGMAKEDTTVLLKAIQYLKGNL